jgi:4-alpha-glucanotransferase
VNAHRFHGGRHAGVLVPLFSIPSSRSWGIGEIPDLKPLAEWLAEAGHDFVQLLPVNEMAEGQNSPYSAMSAMAIDPIFISVQAMEDFEALGGEDRLDAASAGLLASVRAASVVDYASVRLLKGAALRAAFEWFLEQEWQRGTGRAGALESYLEDQRWWLEDYAVFRALHARHDRRFWREWPEPLQRRDPEALAAVRADLEREILYYGYLQWVADTQWHEVRRRMAPFGLFGDFPFMVSIDSADVWARQQEFWLDASVGTPPDAFSETGQDWGLPVYRWDLLRRNDFEWLRHRARRSADLYDGYRVDHLVGFYRTYIRPADGSDPYFDPAEELEQTALGEYLLQIFAAAGPRIIAEDLGTVPDFVRQSMDRLGIPGYKVLRWEREWKVPGRPFHDPAQYRAVSVATSGTHDTDPLVLWWNEASEEERRAVLQIPALGRLPAETAGSPCTPEVRDALLQALFAAGSDLLILPIQDLFGWEDRINVPATVADDNWTYRLPWPVELMRSQPEATERAGVLRRWTEECGRS